MQLGAHERPQVGWDGVGRSRPGEFASGVTGGLCFWESSTKVFFCPGKGEGGLLHS